MIVYTDRTKSAFFKTDKYLKGLHPIEINTIKDFVYTYSIDHEILTCEQCWMVSRFDELVAGNPVLDPSDEPDIHGDWLEIDFIKGMTQPEIDTEIRKYISFED